MKIRLTLLLSLFAVACMAQNFEGVVKWSVKSEITDPKMKAQMEDAQKKMNDPATKAQMEQMKAKMNDPQFKAMMENNPQMKAQMEAAMKMMQGGDMSSMMPKSMTVKVKNGNSLTVMEGGMMAGNETLYLRDKNQSILINQANKTYTIITPKPTDNNSSQQDVKITKTSETQKILGYTCTKTIVTSTSKGTSIDQIFWTTTEIKDFDVKSLSKQRMGSGQPMFYESIEGTPLKMEVNTPQMKMAMEVTAIEKASIADSVFEIPAGFTESQLPGMR